MKMFTLEFNEKPDVAIPFEIYTSNGLLHGPCVHPTRKDCEKFLEGAMTNGYLKTEKIRIVEKEFEPDVWGVCTFVFVVYWENDKKNPLAIPLGKYIKNLSIN